MVDFGPFRVPVLDDVPFSDGGFSDFREIVLEAQTGA
jgi:hypothetical protein